MTVVAVGGAKDDGSCTVIVMIDRSLILQSCVKLSMHISYHHSFFFFFFLLTIVDLLWFY